MFYSVNLLKTEESNEIRDDNLCTAQLTLIPTALKQNMYIKQTTGAFFFLFFLLCTCLCDLSTCKKKKKQVPSNSFCRLTCDWVWGMLDKLIPILQEV